MLTRRYRARPACARRGRERADRREHSDSCGSARLRLQPNAAVAVPAAAEQPPGGGERLAGVPPIARAADARARHDAAQQLLHVHRRQSAAQTHRAHPPHTRASAARRSASNVSPRLTVK